MIPSSNPVELSDQDQLLFATLVPADHYLRQVKAVVDFERYRADLLTHYSPVHGRPAEDPIRLLKLGLLQIHYNLSDREVIATAQVNVAFRYFLDLPLTASLPHPSLLTIFRARLGASGYQRIFDGVVAQARAAGLIKDRLRIKDATHVLANIAVPSTLRLVAQVRQRLLDAAGPFAAEQVAAERAHALAIQTATRDLGAAERLLQRVAHLRQIVVWTDGLVATWEGADPIPTTPAHQALRTALALAHQVLNDRDDPDGGDHVVSPEDPDARRGKHGAYFTGYKVDIVMDADSELLTALAVVPANADEAANASVLIRQEEAVHGNDVQALSIDGIGFRGDLLREWQDPAGLALTVYVPPAPEAAVTGLFPPEAFVLEADGVSLRCPGGATTQQRSRTVVETGWQYRFGLGACRGCVLQPRCLKQPPKTVGRTVVKNDYVAEYRAARAQATTLAYQAVRREHPRIERKLADMIRWHGGRRSRYRGRAKQHVQYLLTGLVVNLKRMVRLRAGQQALMHCGSTHLGALLRRWWQGGARGLPMGHGVTVS
jgi:transposase